MVIEIDHNTTVYVPYSLRTVCGFISAKKISNEQRFVGRDLYGLSSLFKKSSKSNCFQILLQKKFFPNYLKHLGVGPSQGFTPPPPSRQNGAHSVDLIGRWLTDHDHSLELLFKIFLPISRSKATT